MKKITVEELERKLQVLENENKVLKQKNIKIEREFHKVKSVLKEREILAKSLKFEKEKRLEYFNLFLKHCGEIIIAVDKNLKIIYSTEIYKKILELDENIYNSKSKDIYTLYSRYRDKESAKKLVDLCNEVLHTGKEKSAHFYMTSKYNGKEKKAYIIFNVSPAKDEYGEIKQLVIVAKDITEIYEMKEIAEKAAKAKTNFLANTSHEIRTPMNAILGIAELLLRENMSDTAKGHVYNIKSAGTNLLSIINDILDISKIESGKLDILENEYELPSIINDITNMPMGE